MKFLITGGAGFIGSHTAESLVAQGHSVRVLDNLSSGKTENLAFSNKIELIRADIQDRNACLEAARGQDCVIHLAAQVSVAQSMERPEATHRTNIDGTVNLLEAARAAQVKAFVFASSCAVYGDAQNFPIVESSPAQPLSPYAVSKLTGEYYCASYRKLYGLKTCVFRFFNIFGPRQDDRSPYSGVIAIFARKLKASQAPTIFGDGEQSRDFLNVKDVASALGLAAQHPDRFSLPAYNLASEKQTSVNQLYALMAKLAGKNLPPSHAEARQGEVRHSLGSARQFANLSESLGVPYRPLPLAEGLEATWRWYSEAK